MVYHFCFMINNLWSCYIISDLWFMIFVCEWCDFFSRNYGTWSMIYYSWSKIYNSWSIIFDIWCLNCAVWCMLFGVLVRESMTYDVCYISYYQWSIKFHTRIPCTTYKVWFVILISDLWAKFYQVIFISI